MGQFHHRSFMGQDLQRASYGPKDVMGYTWARSENELESLDGPDDATGPNSDRA